MLHQFSQNRYCDLLAIAIVIFLSPIRIAHSNDDKKTLGLIESFETLLGNHKKQYQNSIANHQKNTTTLNDIKNLQSVQLNKNFIKSLLLHTENKYLRFASDDECKFLSLIDTGLAKIARGEIYYIPVSIQFDNDKKKDALITKQDYLNYVYSKRCLNNREMLALFTSKSISKTMESLNLASPKNEKECSKIHNEWTKNPFLPYICAISENIRKKTLAKIRLNNQDYKPSQVKNLERKYFKGDFFDKNVPLYHKEYFASLCSNLYDIENFCNPYLAKDIWSKIKKKEKPSYKMSYKCKNVLNKNNLSPKDFDNCINTFNKNPKICTVSGTQGFSSLYPMPNCNIISKSLVGSSLHTDYHDCPGKIDNHASVNVHRILAHKQKLSIPSNSLSCSSQINYSLAKLSYRWPLNICYFDKIADKKECIPYVPHLTLEEEPLSEGHIVAKILYRNEGIVDKKPCATVSDKVFNSSQLKFKQGCFIIYDSQLCTNLHCKKKIVYDLKEIKGIEYTGVNNFDYFANSFKNEKFSMAKRLEELLKVENKIIRNLTFLTAFFKKHPHAIVHGIGCAEDLLPSFFQKKSLGACNPLTFIVDGIVTKNGLTHLSFRSSIDDVHSPRLVVWDKVFNGVSNYKEIHPLNTFTFYGIK